MLHNYLLVSVRNLLRNRIFSLINVAGLAISLTVGFLIYQYVSFERGYDRFHKNADRIYRIPIEYSRSFASIGASATNHPALGPAMKADFPEVEAFTRLARTSLFGNATALTYEPAPGQAQAVTFNEERLYFADDNFLTFFTFALLEGDASSALVEPRSVVITETTAKKYFGNEPALGKELNLSRRVNLKVTGVLQDIPANSHLQFDALISFSTLAAKFGFENWRWPEYYNYVQLAEGADPRAVDAKLPAFAEKYLGAIMRELDFGSRFYLQPLTDIHLNSHLRLEQDVNGDKQTVSFLILLAVFVLIVAWINYINLSTAKSLERSKEVGLRKVAGATKRQLITQFFFDAFLVNILAIILACGLLTLAMPWFEEVVGKPISSAFPWQNDVSFWLLVATLLLLGTLLVGLYPALLLSSFNPATVLKGKFFKSTKGVMLRKGLVTFQYALSIFLIAGTIAIYRQLSFMQDTDPGYAKDQVLVVRAPSFNDSTLNSRVSRFQNSVSQLSAVDAVASSRDIPGRPLPNRNQVRRAGQNAEDGFVTYFQEIDHAFIQAYGIEIVAGRTFEANERFMFPPCCPINMAAIADYPHKVLINEYASANLGFATPEDALNQEVMVTQGEAQISSQVIGVVRNYNQVSLRDGYDPIVYYYPPNEYWRYFSIRVNTPELATTIADVRTIYQETFPYNAFEYFFLGDYFNKQYQADRQFGKIFGAFAGLAILIACLGLLGLSVYAVTQRTKEVGIRKVLGASVSAILLLFSKDSVRLLAISYAISLPLIYFAIRKWLDGFAFHTPIGWQVFIMPPLFLLLISGMTIAFICIRAALSNPTAALRHE